MLTSTATSLTRCKKPPIRTILPVNASRALRRKARIAGRAAFTEGCSGQALLDE
jgi:hypothetical protein